MYTPTPEFIAALEQIEAIRDDSNTPDVVVALAAATRNGLLELAAKQQILQTMVEEEQGSQQLRAAQTQKSRENQTEQDASSPEYSQHTDGNSSSPGTVLEAVPPLPPPPPGLYGAPRNEDGTGASVRPAGLYEPRRNEDGSEAKE